MSPDIILYIGPAAQYLTLNYRASGPIITCFIWGFAPYLVINIGPAAQYIASNIRAWGPNIKFLLFGAAPQITNAGALGPFFF